MRQEAPSCLGRNHKPALEHSHAGQISRNYHRWLGSTSARWCLISQTRSILTDTETGFILQSEGRGLVYETVSIVSLGNCPFWSINSGSGAEFAGSEPGWKQQPESGWEPDAKGSGTEYHRRFGSVSDGDRQRLGDTASQEKLAVS